MKYDWLASYLLSKKGVVKEYHDIFGVDRYLVAGKMFAMWGGDKTGRPIITLKLDPFNGEVLRERFPGAIIPGYYMNKIHWNSAYLEGGVPDEVLRSMADESYRIIFAELPKKTQKVVTEA